MRKSFIASVSPFSFRGLVVLMVALWMALISAAYPTDTYSEAHVRAGEFKLYKGLFAVLPDFDFEAKCEIVSFTMTYTPLREDPVLIENVGGNFQRIAQEFVKMAKQGDMYTFTDIKVKCPGDKASRTLNPLTALIK